MPFRGGGPTRSMSGVHRAAPVRPNKAPGTSGIWAWGKTAVPWTVCTRLVLSTRGEDSPKEGVPTGEQVHMGVQGEPRRWEAERATVCGAWHCLWRTSLQRGGGWASALGGGPGYLPPAVGLPGAPQRGPAALGAALPSPLGAPCLAGPAPRPSGLPGALSRCIETGGEPQLWEGALGPCPQPTGPPGCTWQVHSEARGEPQPWEGVLGTCPQPPGSWAHRRGAQPSREPLRPPCRGLLHLHPRPPGLRADVPLARGGQGPRGRVRLTAAPAGGDTMHSSYVIGFTLRFLHEYTRIIHIEETREAPSPPAAPPLAFLAATRCRIPPFAFSFTGNAEPEPKDRSLQSSLVTWRTFSVLVLGLKVKPTCREKSILGAPQKLTQAFHK